MQRNYEVPKIPVLLDPDNVNVGARKVLQVIRPHWTDLDKIKYKIFSEGLTNKLYQFYLDGEPSESSVVVKVYGAKTDRMIDREMEIRTMRTLHKENLGPELYAIFENGVAYEFISGKILDTDSCKSPVIYKLVAAEMGRFHSVSLEGPESKESLIWDTFRRINVLAEETLTTNQDLMSKFGELGIKSGWISSAMAELKEIIDRENMPLTFCHNDLLLANVIYNEAASKVTFIDFEYCCLNYAPFDIANHFCEFAGGDDTDFRRCPDEQFQSEWISVYLENLFHGKHSYDVKTFLRWVKICAPFSLVGWMTWGIAQANISTIDFDYVQYVAVRIPEYEKLMRDVRKL